MKSLQATLGRTLGLVATSALAAVTMTGALSAQVPQADYPLINDLLDATGLYGPVALSANGAAVPPAAPNGSGNGVCHDGTYFYSATGGQNIQSPVITSLDQNDFQIEVDFNLAAVPMAFNRPILMGGNSYRWIGLYSDLNGTLGVLYNNSLYTWSTTTVTAGTWYSAAIKYEAGFVELYLNGALIHSDIIGPLNTNNNFNFTTNNFSNGRAYDGCIRNLKISNDTQLAGSYALNTAQGIGCGAGNPIGDGSVYELFDPASPFDLSNTGQTYIWTSTGYILLDGAGAIVPPTGSATAFGDDQTQPIALPFSFPCTQGDINEIYLCSNGWISFEPTTSNDLSESTAELLSQFTRLAFLWDDLNPAAGGTVHAEAVGASEFHITFTDVPEYGQTTTNTCQIVLFDTGLMEVRYGACALADCMVGFSSGNGATDPGATDFSNLSATGAVTFTTGYGPFWSTLELSATTRPVLGTSWDLKVDVIPTGTVAGLHWFGLANPNIVDLGSIGAPGCGLYASPDVPVGFWIPTVGTPYSYSITLPALPLALIGQELFTQAAVATVPASNAFGFETTNGIKATLGDL